MAGTLTVSGMAAGLPSGEKIIGPISASGSSTVGEILDLTLSSGDNSVAVPTGAVAVLIVFSQTGTQAVRARTNLDGSGSNAGCTIAPLAAAPYAVIPLPSGVTSLILNAAGTVSGVEVSFI